MCLCVLEEKIDRMYGHGKAFPRKSWFSRTRTTMKMKLYESSAVLLRCYKFSLKSIFSQIGLKKIRSIWNKNWVMCWYIWSDSQRNVTSTCQKLLLRRSPWTGRNILLKRFMAPTKSTTNTNEWQWGLLIWLVWKMILPWWWHHRWHGTVDNVKKSSGSTYVFQWLKTEGFY